MLRTTSILAITAAIMIPGTVSAQMNQMNQGATLEADQIISLSEWNYEGLYAGGMSAEEFIDEFEVRGVTGEEIGDVEDIIVGTDGQVLAVVAEIGGFLDIGDQHVAVPWNEVDMSAIGDQAIIVPVTEETIEDYDYFGTTVATGSTLGSEITAGLDDQPLGPRAYRVSELIGDYVRLRDADTLANYGYVNDVIIGDGEVKAVIVNATMGYGGGYYAYPYYDPYYFGYGPYYDLPYAADDVNTLEPFDYDRF